MRSILANNVHSALPVTCAALKAEGIEKPSQKGAVLRFATPVTTVYMNPMQRVLYWPQRDANPFFHLMEALWMLRGRNDVEFVARFSANMLNFSDDGETLNGAYGFRWRKHFGTDQLKTIAAALRADATDRQQVLSMYDARHDLGRKSKDIPCNTHAYPQINVDGQLDLMVCNRSNDLVWGAYGANAVHFSVLQEYLAAMIGCPVGLYYQTSMNTHVYLERHGKLLDEMAAIPPGFEDPYSNGPTAVAAKPLVSLPVNRWDRELDALLASGPEGAEPSDPFLAGVARPLWRAWLAFKEGGPYRVGRAQGELLGCWATDWHRAAFEWLERRKEAASGSPVA